MPERDGFCAPCYPACVPDTGGSVRFQVLSEIRHTPPETLAAYADALGIVAMAFGSAFVKVGDTLRRASGLPEGPLPRPRRKYAKKRR